MAIIKKNQNISRLLDKNIIQNILFDSVPQMSTKMKLFGF